MDLFCYYQIIQKRHNIAFIIYAKTYLLWLFLGFLYEPFPKKYIIVVVILIFIQNLLDVHHNIIKYRCFF